MSGDAANGDRIASVLARQRTACREAIRSSPDFTFTEAWLTAMVRAVRYREPTGADAEGFVTVGEIENRGWCKRGYVLLHPGTGEERVVWVFCHRWDP